jgi:predicted DCC family thiol-disulfide oxidoreductase YuxK
MSPAHAILLYDGDCGVCTRLAGFVARRLRPSLPAGARAGGQVYGISAYQDADLGPLGLTPAQCDAALQWVDSSGRISSAQDAVARLLLASRPWARPIGAVLLAPGIDTLAGVVYRTVAANRSRLPGGTPACQLPAAQRPGATP